MPRDGFRYLALPLTTQEDRSLRVQKQNPAQRRSAGVGGGGGKQALPQAGGGFQGLQLQEAQPGISDLECLLWAAFPLPQPPLHRLGASLQSSVFSPLLHSHSREPLIPCGVRSGSRFRPLQLTSSPWFVQVG